jgi:hypothetical protein
MFCLRIRSSAFRAPTHLEQFAIQRDPRAVYLPQRSGVNAIQGRHTVLSPPCMRLYIALKVAFLVSLLLCIFSAVAPGQTASSNPPGPSGSTNELYGGIELSDEGVKVIALRVSQSEEDPVPRLVYRDMIRLRLGRTSGGEFPPQTSEDAAQAVSTALARLREQYRVPLDRIYFIGSSGLGADHPKDLVSVIRNTTGLTLDFLDAVTEVQLSIAGTIPRTGKVGPTSIDNRNTSVLIHIGGVGTQAGYEMFKYSSSDSPAFDFVAMTVPQGAVSYANEISQAVGPSSTLFTFTRQVKTTSAITFRQALRKEIESKPGLMHRKRVFLTGNLAWAMATLLYPADREAFVAITYEDITKFADRIARSPRELVFQNLSLIRDRKQRQDVEKEMEEIRSTFTPQQLIAGAEMLKAAAEELKWQEKKILFARFGHFGGILSYIRLQTGK